MKAKETLSISAYQTSKYFCLLCYCLIFLIIIFLLFLYLATATKASPVCFPEHIFSLDLYLGLLIMIPALVLGFIFLLLQWLLYNFILQNMQESHFYKYIIWFAVIWVHYTLFFSLYSRRIKNSVLLVLWSFGLLSQRIM